MRLGRIVGRVVSTVRDPGLDGVRLLILQPLDDREEPCGGTLVACDAVSANIGEVVFWIGGREAALALPRSFVPVDATILGHVEQVGH